MDTDPVASDRVCSVTAEYTWIKYLLVAGDRVRSCVSCVHTDKKYLPVAGDRVCSVIAEYT